MYLAPIIAHRGFSGLYPENTMTAFEKAVEFGIKSIETDVTILKDRELILFHDYMLDNKSTGRGIVNELSSIDLENIDAGSWKDNIFSDSKISTLKQLLQLIKNTDIVLNLELKGEKNKNEHLWEQIVECTVSLVKEYELSSQVFYSSFEIPMLRFLKEKDPQAHFGILLFDDINNWKQLAEELQPQAFHLSNKLALEQNVKLIKNNGYECYVYTINHLDRAEELFQIGVDGIFTDYLDLLQKYI